MPQKQFDVSSNKNDYEGGGALAEEKEVEMQDDIYKVGKDGVVNKSRRQQIFKQDVTKQLSEASTFYKPKEPKRMIIGEYLFTVIQGLVILIYALTTEYSKDSGMTPDSPATIEDGYDPTKDLVQKLYPFFQDVHVMIFIGFGFLMTFLKTMSWTALSYNWIISIWAFQFAILSLGFWHQVFEEGHWKKIDINLEKMILGDFGAGAAMITFGVLLGKINLQQLMFLIFWQMIFYGLNESIGVLVFQATDMGGSIFVHTFGAYYGLAASYFFQPKRAQKSNNLCDSYQSNTVAMVGSIFLWMYWPSFNGALAVGAAQQRVVVNTVLAISGSCLGAAFVARALFGKLEMEIMLNATLAGGVAIGSASDIIVTPWGSMLIGWAGGVLSAIGFQKIGPFLSEKINLQDTCGVNSLHGMPGIFGAIVSAIAIGASEGKGFPDDYFPATKGEGKTLSDQFWAQIMTLIVTLVISMASGAIGGLICNCGCFQPPHALFRDDDHFIDMQEKYPKSYLKGCDENYDIARMGFNKIKEILTNKRKAMKGNQEMAIEDLVTEIWKSRGLGVDQVMNEKLCEVFLTDYIKQSGQIDMTTEAFKLIFDELDSNMDEQISKREMIDFITKFTE